MKICPILSLVKFGRGIDVYCQEERCAWYNEDDAECAINTLGYHLIGIKQNMDYINRIGGSKE